MTYTDPGTVRVALSPDGDDTDTGTAASMSDNDLNAAIQQADDEIDGKLFGQYVVPFTDTPPLVANIATTIAAYLATLTFRRGNPIDPNDPVRLRYNMAETALAQIMSGAITLIDVDVPPSPSAGGAPVVVNVLAGPLFNPSDYPVPGFVGSGYGGISSNDPAQVFPNSDY